MKGRVLLGTWDPGLYLPEWPEDGEQDGAEFPLRVHLAWELPEDKRRGLKARLRRVTYELGLIGPASRRGAAKDGSPAREYLYTDGGDPILVSGDARNADTGVITRTYPWAPNLSSPGMCFLTDAEWDLDDLTYADLLYDLPMHKARYRIRSDGLDVRVGAKVYLRSRRRSRGLTQQHRGRCCGRSSRSSRARDACAHAGCVGETPSTSSTRRSATYGRARPGAGRSGVTFGAGRAVSPR